MEKVKGVLAARLKDIIIIILIVGVIVTYFRSPVKETSLDLIAGDNSVVSNSIIYRDKEYILLGSIIDIFDFLDNQTIDRDKSTLQFKASVEVLSEEFDMYSDPPGYQLYESRLQSEIYLLESQLAELLDLRAANNARLNEVELDKLDRILGQLIRLPEEDYSIDEADRMIKRIASVHIDFLEALVNNGVRFYLTTTNVTDVPEYNYLKGVTPRGWEGTGMTWDDVPGIGGNPIVARIGYMDSSTVSLELHELAHGIDAYVLDTVSYGSEFMAIWEKEASSIVSRFYWDSYVADYPEEYFAEMFARYYLSDQSRQTVKEIAPETYAFMRDLHLSIKK